MLYEQPADCPASTGSPRNTNNPADKLRGRELHPEWREHPCDSCRPDRVFGYGHGDCNGRLWPARSKARRSSGDSYGPLRDLPVRRLRDDAVRPTCLGWWGADSPPTSRRLALPFLVCLLLGGAVWASQTFGQAKQKAPLAVVAGQPIYDDDLLPFVQAQVFQLRLQEYEVKSKALENLVNQKLLEAEAKKKGIPTDKLLEQEVDAKVPEPTEAELQALYIVQKEQLRKSFDEIKAQLQQLLKQAKLQQARQDYYKRLREQAGVSIFLQKPKVEVAYDPARLRGNPKAPVVIVEFSDFQCPYCRSVQPTLKNLLAKYEGRVSLSYRDLPLRDIHPQAQMAAEASRCAGEQGKFWEYHDLLFENQNKLNREGLVEQARSLKLDEKQFDSCLSSDKYKAQIEHDRQLGLRAGLTGTPGFFINGNMLSGNLPQDSFEKVIQAELADSKGQ